eukprot:6144080-Lingulodinium_polyedra.AAC.1
MRRDSQQAPVLRLAYGLDVSAMTSFSHRSQGPLQQPHCARSQALVFRSRRASALLCHCTSKQ